MTLAAPPPQELCRVVAEAERSVNEGVSKARQRPLSLPGDDVLLLARTAGATAAAAGLGLAVTGSVLRLRGLSEALSSIPTLTDDVRGFAGKSRSASAPTARICCSRW